MVCKKCGYDELISNGDWLKCPHCGAEYFNTKIDFSSISDKNKEIQPQNEALNNSGFNIKEKTYIHSEHKKHIEPVKESQIKTDNDSSSEKKAVNESASKEHKAKRKKSEKKPQSKLKETIDFFTPVVIAVILALVLKQFVFANAIVPTGSMIGTINKNDRIIASRLSYIKEDPKRYDIIMFYFPDDEEKVYVKRTIGLPGEIVNIINGVTYITNTDGEIFETDTQFITEGTPKGDFGPYYIPYKGETIIFNGEDCFASNGMKVGKEEFLERYCEKDEETGNYVVAENCYFCMGDNRNNSVDSRMWDNTYVAKNKILGKVKFRYYPNFEEFK